MAPKLALALLIGVSLGCSPPRDRSRGTPRSDAGVRDAGDRDAGDRDAASDDRDAASEDVGTAIGAPSLRYDGPVTGALPGWDPSSPEPLLALGQASGSTSWYTTLVRIAADGTLSENVSARLVIFGLDDDPPELLYDGPVGGRLSGWNAAAPIPLVMMGRIESADAWTMALARISADGTLSDVVVDRLVVWGWRSGGPRLEWSGPVDAATIGGWNADSPDPLVMGGALGADWFVTLARIDADGSLAENLADTIYIWRW